MLKKFISIKGIGKLLSYSASGDVELKKLNIVYGENGSGKSTICAILKSLSTGNPDIVAGRKSVYATETPQIEIRHDGGNIKFKDNAWDTAKDNLLVFDSSFVSENVHAGHVVDHNHKTALYSYAIGDEGVRLARELQECKEAIVTPTSYKANTEGKIRNGIESAVRAYMDNLTLQARTTAMPFSFAKQSIDDFLLIPKDGDIDSKLKASKRRLTSLEKANEIKEQKLLRNIPFPELNLDDLKSLLMKSLETVSKEADSVIKAHVAGMLDGKGEQWIEYGVSHIKEDRCPFCMQGIAGVELVNKYKEYFNEKYVEFKSFVNSQIDIITRRFDSQTLLPIQKEISANKTLLEYWSKHIDNQPVLPEGIFEQLQEVWEKLSPIVFAAIDAKKGNPLEKVELGRGFEEVVALLDTSRAQFHAYNTEAQKFNELINKKKEDVEAGDLTGEVSQVYMLLIQKYRHRIASSGI